VTSQCQSCGAAVLDTVICGRCESDTRDRLARQETWRQELLTVLARQTRTEAANDGGRAASLTLAWAQMGDRFLDSIDGKELKQILASLPPAQRAANTLRAQRELLLSWCRTLSRDGIPAYWSEASVQLLAEYLLANLHIIRKHETAGDYTNRLRALETRIIQTIDLPQERTRVDVGPCPNLWPNPEGHTEPCPGQITAHFPRDLDQPAMMKCSECRAEFDTTQWTRVGILIQRRKEQLEQQRTLAQQFIGKAAS
jgi:hypothetical protein